MSVAALYIWLERPARPPLLAKVQHSLEHKKYSAVRSGVARGLLSLFVFSCIISVESQ